MARRNVNKQMTNRRATTSRSREEMPELETESRSFSGSRGTSSNRRSTSGSRSQGIDFRGDYKDILRELAASPTVRYVAGGIATALLTRLANNWSEKYPEISTFIRENISTLEGKFGTNKVGMGDSTSQRH